MANDGEIRRLAAIMASDVVGYSALMGRDEAGTLSAIRALRKELWGPKIDEYGGRVVKTTGDGQLTEFPSVADAVQCAVEVQRAMRRRNDDIPEDHRIVLRVGINQGDVIVDGDDIYGDGVNVAARLEEIAEPGGICISRSVRDQIRDKLLFRLEDQGEQELKNIARPVRVFRVSIEETGDSGGARTSAPPAKAPPPAAAPPAQPAAPTNRLWQGIAGVAVVAALVAIYVVNVWQPWLTRVDAANVADMAFPLPDKPSIAVLAFDNLSAADDELLANSFSEDILTSLSKLSGLFVVSRTTTFTYKGTNATVKQIAEDLGVRYVLEGSIQRDGDSLRVNAQLIDAIGGQHVWADRYDRDLADLFAVKDDITLNVISNISAELLGGAPDKVTGRETESLEAWLLFQQGRAEYFKFSRESGEVAKDLLERALAIDPGFATALSYLGSVYRYEGQRRYTDTPEASIEKAGVLYDRALALDPNNTHATSGKFLHYSVIGQHDLALELQQRAVDLDPNDATSRALFAYRLLDNRQPIDAVRNWRLARLEKQLVAPKVEVLWVDVDSGETHEGVIKARYGDQVPPDVEPITVSWMPQA